MSDWTFVGDVVAVLEKTTKKGRTFRTLILSRKDAKRETFCVADCWIDLPGGAEVGATVEAEGDMSAREWQGRWYAGLTVSHIDVVRVAVGADAPGPTQDEPQAAEPTPDKGADARPNVGHPGEEAELPF